MALRFRVQNCCTRKTTTRPPRTGERKTQSPNRLGPSLILASYQMLNVPL